MEAGSGNFFQSLRELAADLDRGLKKVRCESGSGYTITTSRQTCVETVQNFRKEVNDIRTESKKELQNLRENGAEFEKFITACQLFLQQQSEDLMFVEGYMKKYGYQPWEPQNESYQSQPLLEAEETENKSVPVTNNIDMEPHEMRTPKLEDFGLSRARLNAVLLSDRKAVGTTHYDNSCQRFVRSSRIVTVTPRLHNGINSPMLCGGNAMFPDCTPQCFGQGDEQWSRDTVDSFKYYKMFVVPKCSMPLCEKSLSIRKVCKNLEAEMCLVEDIKASPASSAFCTPSLQKLTTQDCCRKTIHEGISSHSMKSLFASGHKPAMGDKDAVRTEMGPMTGQESLVPTKEIIQPDECNYLNEMPQPPEMTFRFEVPVTSTSVQKNSKQPTLPEHHQKMVCTLSSPPEELSHQRDVLNSMLPQMPKLMTPEPFRKVGYNPAPPQPPKLLGKYNFLTSSKLI